MEVVPDLVHDSPSIVGRVCAGDSLVISGAAASNVWQRAVAIGQSGLEVAEGVGGGVAWSDAGGEKEAPGRQAAVVHDCGLEEVDNLLVLDVFGPVAGHVKGRVTSRMLGEFVAPEVGVGGALVDPVPVMLSQWVVPLHLFRFKAYLFIHASRS